MTIDERWEDYRKKVIPSDAGSIQVAETKRAFYAGAAVSLNINQEELRKQLDAYIQRFADIHNLQRNP